MCSADKMADRSTRSSARRRRTDLWDMRLRRSRRQSERLSPPQPRTRFRHPSPQPHRARRYHSIHRNPVNRRPHPEAFVLRPHLRSARCQFLAHPSLRSRPHCPSRRPHEIGVHSLSPA
jgi:hypothetical protein